MFDPYEYKGCKIYCERLGEVSILVPDYDNPYNWIFAGKFKTEKQAKLAITRHLKGL